MSTLKEAFSEFPDHRDKRGLQYDLGTLLLAVTAGFMCGRDSLLGVALFIQGLSRPQREALGFLWFKVPCHATLCVTFHGMDVVGLEKILSRVALEGREAGKPLHLAIDGKALPGSQTQEMPKGAQMLACFSDTLKGVVGQQSTRGGYDEITSAIALLKNLPLKDTVITGDAMFADRHLCEVIVESGGNYIFPVKANQPSLKRGALAALEKSLSPRRRGTTRRRMRKPIAATGASTVAGLK